MMGWAVSPPLQRIAPTPSSPAPSSSPFLTCLGRRLDDDLGGVSATPMTHPHPSLPCPLLLPPPPLRRRFDDDLGCVKPHDLYRARSQSRPQPPTRWRRHRGRASLHEGDDCSRCHHPYTVGCIIGAALCFQCSCILVSVDLRRWGSSPLRRCRCCPKCLDRSGGGWLGRRRLRSGWRRRRVGRRRGGAPGGRGGGQGAEQTDLRKRQACNRSSSQAACGDGS